MKLLVQQLDVKLAFLNGEPEEEVYVEQPQGYEVQGHEDKVYHLKKALYGLKKAPRAQNRKIDDYFQENGFKRSPSEPFLYIKTHGSYDFLILCLYVDDLIFMRTNEVLIEEFKKGMLNQYEIIDLDLLKYFLTMQVKQEHERFFLS